MGCRGPSHARARSPTTSRVAPTREFLGGGGTSPHAHDLAREAAEGQIDIMRVREVRQRLIEDVITQASGARAGEKEVNPAAIDRLERYERRAETRRNNALARLVRRLQAEATSSEAADIVVARETAKAKCE